MIDNSCAGWYGTKCSVESRLTSII